MPCQLEKKSTVVWEVVPAIEAAQLTIAKVYLAAGGKAVVTSAHDGVHSLKSTHRQADKDAKASAIDLRITNLFRGTLVLADWYGIIRSFAKTLAAALNQEIANGHFFVVLEKDHLHLEFTPDGMIPNIIGYSERQSVYATKEVLALLNPKPQEVKA